MAPVTDLGGLQVENVKFPAKIKPPASANTLFLGGAGTTIFLRRQSDRM